MAGMTAPSESRPLFPLAPVNQGAGISVISPASFAHPERVDRGLESLRSLGYAPSLGENALTRGPLFFAGTPEHRLADLHDAFANTSTSMVAAVRGGYGSNYILGALDLELIRKHPKPFFAYSDLTGMQLRLLDELGLPAFHGPMVAADFSLEDGVHLASFHAALAGEPYALGGDGRPAYAEARHSARNALRWLPQHSRFAAGHAMGTVHRGQAALP